jgi:osmoprotectant transport system substrate-binding protein
VQSSGTEGTRPRGPGRHLAAIGGRVWQPGQVRPWLAVLLLFATACSAVGPGAGAEPDPTQEPIRVGSGPDAESVLLAAVMVSLLERSELPAEPVPFSDARDARQAIELGAIDVRPAYTGEAWLETLGRSDPPGDPQASFTAVYEHDRGQGIVWLRPRFGEGLDQPPANATFAFVVPGPPALDADLRTMSQLAARLSEQPEARICVDPEFADRVDGLQAVLAAYSVRSDRDFLAAAPAEAVRGVAAGACLAGLTTTTDGAAWRSGLYPLFDDLRVFPAFVPLPQVRGQALRSRPGIRAALGPMSAQLTTALLGRWNARVAGGEPVERVAEDAALELLARAGRLPVIPGS